MNYNDLRKEFRLQSETLIKDILTKVQPKVICNAPLNGRHFTELIASYVQTMNGQGIPSITSAWERIVDKEYRNLKELLKMNINNFMKNEVNLSMIVQLQPNLPMAPESIYTMINTKQ